MAKDVKKTEKGEIEKRNPEETINNHVGLSMVAGAIPFPVLDIIAVTAIQMDMLQQLATTYDVDFNNDRGKSLISALIASSVGSKLGSLGASALKVVPGIGTILGIGSQVILAGASTFAIGKIFQSHFQNDGNLFDFDVEGMISRFEDYLESGKIVAEEKQKSQSKNDILETIDKLKELKDKGVITEAEFNKTKKELLDKLKS
jgi:uncharacterized protein (DUF697 family)